MDYCGSYFSFNIAHDSSDCQAFKRNLNVFCMIGILILNICTIHLTSKSRKSVGRRKTKDEKTLIVRMLILSCTNLLSWAVALPLSAMSVSGYDTDTSVTAWLAIVGIPINSLISPLVYTFTTRSFKVWLWHSK